MDYLLPKLLVCDDDPGVIAAYKAVLEAMSVDGEARRLFGLHNVEKELFGNTLIPGYPVQWRIDYVHSGEAAVECVHRSMIDGDVYSAAFLDVRMPPGIDGREAALQIRAMDPHVHIVIVTGYSDYAIEDFDEVAGPEGRLTFMTKPVWPDQLRALAERLAKRESYRKTPDGPIAIYKISERVK
jgi:CheY-like chemotaxis protein